MAENNSYNKQKYTRHEYISRINRVIDYIESNIDKELTLENLAGVANFSRFHFHRIFQSMVGETLNHFIQRIRLEKAALQLIQNPKKSITEIAFDCGFSGSATFARAFKDFHRMSASEWRAGGYQQDRNIRKTDSNTGKKESNTGKEKKYSSNYITGVTVNQNQRRNLMFDNKSIQADVKVKHMPEFHVAYIRYIGPYKGNTALFENLFGRLFKWAGPRDLIKHPETKVLCVYHDDPEITEEAKLRTSVCISVPEDTPVEGEIGKMLIPGGKYAVARFELSADEYQQAWNAVCGGWLPDSGYQPDDRPCFELYHNDYREHPKRKSIVDICIPVKPL
ncbi:AraC family transcriptional regulator [candidate division KSB1 bacterium]|nr:AraC family transcriptional regulator [candidate division KSB1 bacterium]